MISVSSLCKTFPTKDNQTRALDNVSIEVSEGEFFALLGASGSGKTTLLRCVAGLETPDSGEISLGSRLVVSSSRGISVPVEDRGAGMVFQSYAIWPHMTVFENISVPLSQGRNKLPKGQVKGRVMEALRMVGMDHVAHRPAPLLSGGQQQRVALARALAIEPHVLLMDEPLSNLDARLREEIREEIKLVAKKAGATVLYVTHDQGEAMDLGDRIAIMAEGRVLQIGTAEELYSAPAGPNVAQFLGSTNWLSGKVVSSDRILTPIGEVMVSSAGSADEIGKKVTLAIRPENIRLSQVGDGSVATNNTFPGTIETQAFLGDHRLYSVQLKGECSLSVKSRVSEDLHGSVQVHISSSEILVFPDVATEVPLDGPE